MGYTTDFEGQFNLDKPLQPEHAAYLRAFADTRRMNRNPVIAEKMDDPVRLAAQLPIGVNGEFFVGGKGMAGQNRDESIIDYNDSPGTQPGLWCKWVPNEDDTAIEWSGVEKFYDYIEWLKYLIQNFLSPWGYNLSGQVEWQGEEMSDRGLIVVNNNVVTTKVASYKYEDDDES